MQTKSLFLSILGILLLAFTFSYSLVFAVPYVGEAKYDVQYVSDNVLLDSLDLNKNLIVIDATHPVEDFSIEGACGAYGKIIGRKLKYSLLQVGFSDTKCSEKKVPMVLTIGDFQFTKTFNLISDFDLYALHLDRSDENIKMLLSALDGKIAQEQVVSSNALEKLQHERTIAEMSYMKVFFSNILSSRAEKYAIPVTGGVFPTALNKVPNTGRPYRSSYTDGIHHGWDFDGKKQDALIALDDGIIVRIVDGFTFADFKKLKKQGKLTQEELLKNLDILRGNQVWLKTMKGDVAFYSHMDTIAADIKVGDVVQKGQTLGTMGASGVPEVGYNDFHLHLAIQHNPYLRSKIANNSFMDYMKWDWSFKGQTAQYALEHIGDIFQK